MKVTKSQVITEVVTIEPDEGEKFLTFWDSLGLAAPGGSTVAGQLTLTYQKEIKDVEASA